jgi:hypothetical protein
LREEIGPILRCIADNGLILGTGHVSAKEGKTLVRKAMELGVKKVLITHPQAPFLDWTLDGMREMVERGAFLEQDIVFSLPGAKGGVSSAKIAEVIRAVGPSHCVMATDGGQAFNPSPVEMMRYFIREMLAQGIREEDIERMARENPARLLDLR